MDACPSRWSLTIRIPKVRGILPEVPGQEQAMHDEIEEKPNRTKRQRLSDECDRLDVGLERAMAEEGIMDIVEWTEC